MQTSSDFQQSLKDWFKHRRITEECTCDIDQSCWYHMSEDEQNEERANSIWEYVIKPWLDEVYLAITGVIK